MKKNNNILVLEDDYATWEQIKNGFHDIINNEDGMFNIFPNDNKSFREIKDLLVYNDYKKIIERDWSLENSEKIDVYVVDIQIKPRITEGHDPPDMVGWKFLETLEKVRGDYDKYYYIIMTAFNPQNGSINLNKYDSKRVILKVDTPLYLLSSAIKRIIDIESRRQSS